MRPGNPVPTDVRVGSWQDPAGQHMQGLILTRAHSEVAGVTPRKGGTGAQPPPQPHRPAGGWRRAAAPLAAALAVAVVISGLVLVAHLAPTPSRHSGGALAAADKGMPNLYVTLSLQGEPTRVVAEVHSSRTGQVLSKADMGTVASPPWITADRSGHTYVINAGTRNGANALFLLRVSGNGESAKITKLPIDLTGAASHEVVDGLALSPDGSKLAIELQDARGKSVQNLTGTIRVYRLAGGTPQTWAAPGDPGLPFSPVWTGPGQLTFVWQDHLRGSDWFYTGRSQIRTLDTSAPGRNLLSSRVLVTGGGRLGFIQSALAGPGNAPIYAATFRVSGGTSGTASLQLAELSATGAVSKVFAKPTFHYSGQVQEGRVVARCQVLGIDATGQHTLALCPNFGRIDNGKFTPLPYSSTDFGADW
jgi:hypothetical protein